MADKFALNIPGSVLCGAGTAFEIPSLVKRAGKFHPVLFIDAGLLKSGCADALLSSLKSELPGLAVISDVPPEPEEGQVKAIFGEMKALECDCIIAVGGGSVMDTAKYVSVMLTNPDYFDDLTDASKIVNRGVPLIAAPTSAGTGSEATPNSIILIPSKKLKVGVVHSYFLPSQVVLDCELTKSLPAKITASTGVDALCHCVETYISKKATPFSRMFSLEGLRLISKSLRGAYNDADEVSRQNMLLAAFYGGVAISCSSTVAVHALSYPLGGSYRIPHGVSNAVLLPHVMDFNADAIADELPALCEAIGIDAIGKSAEELSKAFVGEMFAIVRDVGIPQSLRELGIGDGDLDFLVDSASEVHRLLDQNPKAMSKDDIRSVYLRLM